MSNDVDETTVRLPHTGMWVPDRSLAVTNYKQLKTSGGVAFTATLRRGRRCVGVVENGGHGGVTVLHPDDRREFNEQHLEEYAGLCRTAEGEPVSAEWLLEELVTEAEWDRKVKRATARGVLQLRLMDASSEGLAPWTVASWSCSMPRDDRQWASLAGQITAIPDAAPTDGQWWQGWTGRAWRDVTSRPAGVDAGLYH